MPHVIRYRRLTALFLLALFTAPVFANVKSTLPDFYSEPGLNPFRDQVSANATENIDPFSGGLNLGYTDVFIPGNGGLDIRVQRSYNSNNVYLSRDLTASGTANQTTLQLRSTVGLGWTMHFGRVIRSGNNVAPCDTNRINANDDTLDNAVLELPDGSEQILFVNATTYDPTNAIFITKDNWVAYCMMSGNLQSGLRVVSPDGTQYVMNYRRVGTSTYTGETTWAWYTTSITDRNGNALTILYDDTASAPNKEAILKEISSSDGRRVTFTYTDRTDYQKIRLTAVTTTDAITGLSRTWTYLYTAITVPLGGHYFLSEVQNPDGTKWTYAYWSRTNGAAGNRVLSTVTHPQGGTTSYDYSYICFMGLSCPGSSNTLYSLVVSTKTNGGRDVAAGTWAYAYAPSSTEDVTTVTFPGGKYVYRHYGSKAVFGTSTQCMTGFTGTWRIGLLKSKETYNIATSATVPINTETYTWDRLYKISNEEYVRPPYDGSNLNHPKYSDCDVFAPVLTQKQIVRDGTIYTTTFSNFDASAKPQTIAETGQAARTTTITYFPRTIGQNIVGLTKDEVLVGQSTSKNIYRTFDATGNLRQITRHGVTDNYTYFTSGDVNTHTDANGKVWTYTNYFRGIPRNETHPENVTLSRVVNGTGTIASETNGRGFTTAYTYDSMNRVASIARSLGTAISVTWSATQRNVARGSYSQVTTFNGFGQPSLVNTGGITKDINYNALGQKTFESYPGVATGDTLTNDTLGRVLSVTHADSTQFKNQYLAGNIVRATNERNYATSYTYRSFGDPDNADDKELMRIDAPENVSTVFVRDIIGLPASVAQGGFTRSYTYDPNNNFLLTETHPETGVTTYTRDGLGNMRTRQVGASGTTTYVYDGLSRLKSIDYPGTSPDVTLDYDNNNNLKSVINPTVMRSLVYDANDNNTSETLSFGGIDLSATYGYNALDYLSSITYPSSRQVTYSPDALGRPTVVSPYITSIAHHPNGIPSSITHANGHVVTVAINGNSRQWISRISTQKGGNYADDISYGYDGVGNVSSITNAVIAADSKSMSYDGLDRLKTAGTASMNYDAVGNILSMTNSAGSLTYAYNASTNKLNTVSGYKNSSFSYDVYGNVTGNTRNTFVYDDSGSLRTVGGTATAAYDYDGKNQRVRTNANGQTTLYLYGLNGLLLGEYDSTGYWNKEYAYLGAKLVTMAENVPDAPATPPTISVPAFTSTGTYVVSWGASTPGTTPITRYELQESQNPNFTQTSIAYSGPNLSASFTGERLNGGYYYRVKACSGIACSAYLVATNYLNMGTTPSVPSSITAPSTSSTGYYAISWGASPGYVTVYVAEEATDPSFTQPRVVQQNSNSLNTTILGRPNGTYYYRVRAYNVNYASPWLTSGPTVVSIPVPTAPSSISVPTTSTGNYTVSWGGATVIVTRYELYEATDSGFAGEALVYSGVALSSVFSAKSAGTYYYRVLACNNTGCGSNATGSNPVVVAP